MSKDFVITITLPTAELYEKTNTVVFAIWFHCSKSEGEVPFKNEHTHKY